MARAPGSLAIAVVSLTLTAGPVLSQAPRGYDRHLPESQDPVVLEQVRYSFHETFPYALSDTTGEYGTVGQFRALYPDAYWEDGLSRLTNEDGTLAWTTSRDMMALAVMYDVTGDPAMLEWLRRYVLAALATRDDRAGRTDVSGHSSPGWGSSRYGEGKRRIYLVHTALIVQPMLEWAIRAPSAPGYDAQRGLDRTSVIEACKTSLAYHEYQLETAGPSAGAVYRTGHEEEDRAFLWQPFNRQNIMARNFHLMFQLTGEPPYRERAEKLLRFFKDRLELTPGDAYVWEYEPMRHSERVQVAACEDVSHASFSIEAISPFFSEGWVFDTTDRDRFARTFTNHVHLGGGVFQSSIGCTAIFTRRYMTRMYAWLPLAPSDPRIYDLLLAFYQRNIANPPPLAVAYFASFRPHGWRPSIEDGSTRH